MTKLIPFGQKFIAGSSVRTVSGRELHKFLGVGRDFSNWMKGRIHQYRFVEKADYLKVFAKTGVNSSRGRGEVNYHLTMDMAKELAMVERTEKGREARRYFLDCERELLERKTAPPPALPAPVHPQLDLQSVIPTRLLVTVKQGQIVSTQDVSDCHVVDAVHLKALKINAALLLEQAKAVLGEGSMNSLYEPLALLE